MIDLSICIPTYECRGKGVQYLSELFSTLRSQTFQNYDIVISDHSINDDIYAYCESQSDLEITYVRNPNDRGNQAANTNCALDQAEGKIIKIMYQDDLFVDNRALDRIIAAFNNGALWVMNAFTHTENGKDFYRPKIPQWNKELLIGRNLMGSPSCFAILNEKKQKMDENLRLLVDAELYHRLIKDIGFPYIIEDVLIANREHPDRISSNINYDIQIDHPEGGWLMNKKEFDYVVHKHRYGMTDR